MSKPCNDLLMTCNAFHPLSGGFVPGLGKFPFFWGSTTMSADGPLDIGIILGCACVLMVSIQVSYHIPNLAQPTSSPCNFVSQKRPRLSCPQEFLQFTAMFPQQPAGFKPALLVHGRPLDDMNVIKKGAMTMDKKRNTQAILDQLDIFF